MTGAATRRGAAAALTVILVGGCELKEITVAEPDDLVVIEAMVQVRPDEGSSVYVILHRTFGPGDGAVRGASVRVVPVDAPGFAARETAAITPCLVEGVALDPAAARGTCYTAEVAQGVAPGRLVRLEIETAEGERIEAETTVPGPFTFQRPTTLSGGCTLEADRLLELSWGASEGAWAYVAETEIFGLPAAFAPLGITFEDDPLYLLGLSIGGEDTSIVFPSEFGVFDRFDLDRDVALYLQKGVPPATVSRVTVAAVDRNYTNWVRGGNFNPSGTVRVPSVHGDGTGFFGSAYVRALGLFVNPAPGGGVHPQPRC